MRIASNWFASAVVKGAATGCVLFVAVVGFRLGPLLVFIAPLGAAVVAAITLRDQRRSGQSGFGIVLAVLSYAVVTATLFYTLTNQRSRRTFQMTWRDGPGSRLGESEVVLEFTDAPGHRVGIYSTALRDHLLATGTAHTEVEFEVVSDVWCLRGFHEVRIGDLDDLSRLKRIGGYASSTGHVQPPWGSPRWWCGR